MPSYTSSDLEIVQCKTEMWRVYISSTYEDLKECRLAVRDAILGLGHHPVGMEDYAASDERPQDKCTDDVRSCDAYICIVAWRYGFRPNGGPKSITHLEYDAARNAGISRLVFLLDENAKWPRALIPDGEQAAVRQFRELLSAETTRAQFTDASDLARRVMQALACAIIHPQTSNGDAATEPRPPISDLLPYLCDRSDQEYALTQLINRAARFPQRPTVAIVHGDETEALDKFLERLQKDMLPKVLSSGSEHTPVRRYRLEWPPNFRDCTELHGRLEMGLANTVLGTLRGSRETINDRLARNLSPSLIHSHLLTDNWIERGNTLDDFVSFWSGWPELQVSQLVFVVLFLKYQVSSKLGLARLRSLRRVNEEIRGALERYDFAPFAPPPACPDTAGLSGAVLPELKGPTLGEAQDWARHDQVSNFRDSNELAEELAQFYDNWGTKEKRRVIPIRIPTEELAPKLRDLLSRPGRIA